MKKISVILALLLVAAMALTACQPATPTPTNAPTNAPTQPTQGKPEPVIYDSVKDFHKENGQEGAWQYFFTSDNGTTFDPCQSYDVYTDASVEGWHPWEGDYHGVGLNKDVENFLELNGEPDGLTGVLAFAAPADGKYVLTAAVWNPWEQDCGKFRFVKNDGTVILEHDYAELVAVYGYIQPTDVELKAGEIIYMYAPANSGWVSAYINAIVYYEPADDSCYEVPEVPQPTTPEKIIPNVDGAAHSATAEFSKESADGLWVYASTTDGKTYTIATKYEEQDWDSDGTADANQWYSANGTGIGFNLQGVGTDWIEANVTNSPENGGEIMALGFKAPEAGTYKLTIFTQNMWNANSDHVVVSVNGEDVATVDFTAEVISKEVEVTLGAGEIAYIHGTSNGEWVSTYLAVFVS